MTSLGRACLAINNTPNLSILHLFNFILLLQVLKAAQIATILPGLECFQDKTTWKGIFSLHPQDSLTNWPILSVFEHIAQRRFCDLPSSYKMPALYPPPWAFHAFSEDSLPMKLIMTFDFIFLIIFDMLSLSLHRKKTHSYQNAFLSPSIHQFLPFLPSRGETVIGSLAKCPVTEWSILCTPTQRQFVSHRPRLKDSIFPA